MERLTHIRIGVDGEERELRARRLRLSGTAALASLLSVAVLALVLTSSPGGLRTSSLVPTKAATTAAAKSKLIEFEQPDPHHPEADGQVSIDCKAVSHLMGPGIKHYVKELMKDKGHCGTDSNPQFHCHNAWEEMLLTQSVFVLGSCGNDPTVYEIHVAKAESPELAEDDETLESFGGDPDASYRPCLPKLKDVHGNFVPQTTFEKLECYYHLLEIHKVAGSQADLAMGTKLVDAVNKKSAGWKAKNYKEFATMTKETFAKNKLGLKMPSKEVLEEVPKAEMTLLASTNSYDFRESYPNCLANRIRNQGMCGSCYAFAATKVYDLSLCQHTAAHYNVEISTQQAVSCFNDDGCNGGWVGPVWDDMKQDGFHTRRCLPYEGVDANDEGGITCDTDQLCTDDLTYKVHSYHAVAPGPNLSIEQAIESALQQYGPLWVGFKVCESFMTYEGGIYEPTEPEGIDCAPAGYHAVAMIGYTPDSWILANSWGQGWGEAGFFRMARGEKNMIWLDYVFAVTPESAETMACQHQPACQNGGAFKTDCSCICPEGYTGVQCELCDAVCYNGGMVNPNDCTCSCPEGTWGDSCQYKFAVQWSGFDHLSMEANLTVEWAIKEYHPTSEQFANAIVRFTDESYSSVCGDGALNICGVRPISAPSGSMEINGLELGYSSSPDQPNKICIGMYAFLGTNEFGASKGYEMLKSHTCLALEHNANYDGGWCLTGGDPIYDTAMPTFHLQCHMEPPTLPHECHNPAGDDACEMYVGWGDCHNEWAEWMYENCARACGFDCFAPFTGGSGASTGSGASSEPFCYSTADCQNSIGPDAFCNMDQSTHGTCETCGMCTSGCDACAFIDVLGTMECQSVCENSHGSGTSGGSGAIWIPYNDSCASSSDCFENFGPGHYCDGETCRDCGYCSSSSCHSCGLPGEFAAYDCEMECEFALHSGTGSGVSDGSGADPHMECWSTWDCQQMYHSGAYCNFDYGYGGFCEFCGGCPNGCYKCGFLHHVAADECAWTCESQPVGSGHSSQSDYHSGSMHGSGDHHLVASCITSYDCEMYYGPNVSYCNMDYGTHGFCEFCGSCMNGCQSCGFTDMLGEMECQSVCEGPGLHDVAFHHSPIYCFSSYDCPSGDFCNMDYGYEGLCESCEHLPNGSCEGFVHHLGAVECDATCHGTGSGHSGAGSMAGSGHHNDHKICHSTQDCETAFGTGHYCNHDGGFEGFCEQCGFCPHGCANCGFTNHAGLLQCEAVCEAVASGHGSGHGSGLNSGHGSGSGSGHFDPTPVNCYNNLECQWMYGMGAYCNMDQGFYGYCEYCGMCSTGCAQCGFMHHQGTLACEAACEGPQAGSGTGSSLGSGAGSAAGSGHQHTCTSASDCSVFGPGHFCNMLEGNTGYCEHCNEWCGASCDHCGLPHLGVEQCHSTCSGSSFGSGGAGGSGHMPGSDYYEPMMCWSTAQCSEEYMIPHSYCNMDYGDHGYCEQCGQCHSGCSNCGFLHENGAHECQATCESA